MNKRILYIIAGVVVVIGILVVTMKRDVKSVAATAAAPQSEVDVKELYEQAASYSQEGKLLKARESYKKIFMEHPDFENIDLVQKELEDVNMKIIFSNTPTEKTVIHEVRSGDTLGELSKKYGTTIELIKASNHLKSDVIRVGQRLRMWTGTFNMLVDKSQNILILKDGAEVIKVYDVSTGQESSTPVGEFKVTSRLIDPVWFNRGVVLPPESPQNVLGSRWLGFDIPGYGIHGTVDPESIGQHVTAGCVRMRNRDVEELYNLIPMGTEVVIIN